MKNRSILLAGLAASATLALAACSQGTPPPKTEADKIKMANEIAGLTTDPAMFDQMFDAMTQQVKLATSSQSQLCASQKDVARCEQIETRVQAEAQAFMKETMDQTKAMVPDLMTDMAAIMAQTYSGEELAKMKDFYASEEGKSIMMKQPQVMQQFLPVVMQKMQPLQTQRAQELVARLQKAREEAVAAAGPEPK